MAKKPTLTEIQTRHQVFLERLKTGEARKFTAFLKQSERDIRSILFALDEPDISKLKRSQLNRVLRDIKESQQVLLLQNEKALFTSLEEIAGHEAAFEQRAIQQNVKRHLRKRVNAAPAAVAFTNSLREPLSANGELLKTFVRNQSNVYIKNVNNLVRQAWVNGQTTDQLARSIRGTKGANFNDGLIGLTRRQAEAVARTAVQHTSAKAREATWGVNKEIIKKYKYVATLDLKTTAKCRGLDGLIFDVGKGPTPPVHIGCRSTTVPILEDAFAAFEADGTRAAKGGPVSANLSYYQWLKQQPRGFQNEAIGPQRAKLLRSNKLSAERFSRLSLDRNFEPRTLEEMKRAEPALFSSN